MGESLLLALKVEGATSQGMGLTASQDTGCASFHRKGQSLLQPRVLGTDVRASEERTGQPTPRFQPGGP